MSQSAPLGSAPSARPYRELTVASVALGVVLGSLMTAAFVYIALKLGFTLPGSTVAAILGFAVLRGAMRKGTIVENNINQTIASGINTASAGVAFTLPALYLMSVTNPSLRGFALWPFILAAIAGTFLGVVLILPLRKQLIEFERLRFPSGIAVSKILRSPGAGLRQAALLGGGFLAAALFHAMANLHLVPEEADFGAMLGVPSYVPIVVAISFANFGAGLLSGKGGLPFLGGGILAWWIISPTATQAGWVPDPGVTGQEGWQSLMVYLTMLRPLGIGILVGGALAGVVASFPALKSAVQSLSKAARTRSAGGEASDAESEELGSRVLYTGLGGAMLVLFGAALFATETVTLFQAAAIAVVGTLWLAIAGLIVAEATGRTDISPLSGMALIAVTLMFFLTGGNIVASVLLGVAVCIGIGQCADMMSDLKTGHLVGSTPKNQQIAQFAVSWIGAPVAIGVVLLLWNGPGFGPGTDLPAPQAGALQGIIESLVGGDVALDKYVAGTLIGGALGVFPLSGLGVLVGLAMYLPFSITLGYGLGCLTSMGLARWKGPKWIGSTLVPVAAGFIVGEALTNLGFNLVQLLAS